MYLEEINIIKTSPCLAEENMLRIEAVFSSKIADLMPFLNAVLANPNYDPEKNTITYMMGEKIYFLQERGVCITKLANMTEAYRAIDSLRDFLNDIFDRRDSIVPVNERRTRPGPIAIYKLLPKTNCKKCGEPTCLAFAAKLNLQGTALELCSDLFSDRYSNEKNDLIKLLEG